VVGPDVGFPLVVVDGFIEVDGLVIVGSLVEVDAPVEEDELRTVELE
jgi:hypothetical protein